MLSDEQIIGKAHETKLYQDEINYRTPLWVLTQQELERFARAIEAEVRKQDDELVRQMHDALCECAEDSQEQLDRMEAAKLRQYKPQAVACQEATIDAAKRAITAARARLSERRNAS